ncbi:MAG: hypothetical protein HUU20_24720 [Pirellulales bacterium]|nr:hypothetical protein [Pirellulales bacterium]
MTGHDDLAPADNPFSARHVRPGAIPYRFPPGESSETLLARLGQAGWRGQIVGPHGSGKSTLVAALLPLVEQAGVPAVLVELHDGQRTLPVDLQRTRLAPRTLVVVDGYEQLSILSRARLCWCCRRKRLGLLVTTHRPVRLPVLFETRTGPDLANRLVRELLAGEAEFVEPEEVSRRLEEHGGNLREVLFDLYDLYEQRRMQRRDR